ncbi:hypothetical protein EZV76_02115 [Flagellimonas alvinocaridis]|uniref:BIG2 domain-containing protein n=1 Tax=Flagellimonas alvinocaridis TaxID=2530200 RepID=A0A4S8RV76_9FLAO|nr:IPT/TIG domain-containing protein [Allomuricauda alvinocaridis]THV61145.1 hypothetical protein EZV76_02115 [Allomuricauda alvinocaridis]
MRKIILGTSFVLSFCLVIFSCTKDENPDPSEQQGPKISSFSPLSGPVGTNVFITGKNFDPKAANNVVKIGETKATVTSANATEIFITVPEGATTGKISISVNGNTDTGGTFTVTQQESTALSLDKETLELRTLEEGIIAATVTGAGAEDQITWGSDDENVAIVDAEGRVTATGAGTTTITATVDNASASAILTVNPGIFVGGYTEKNNGEYGVATVWQNGFSQEISQISSYDTYIAIEGPNLYATHVEYGEGTRPIKVYKNNTLFETIGSPEENNKAPKGIQVIDGQIHICGLEVTNGTQYAKYWVNGEETLLSEEGQPASAQGAYVKDGHIYIAGRVYTNTHNALYWVDGNTYDLTENVSSNTYDIFVDDNNDVYVAGHMGSEATIWKNTDVLYDLGDGINSTATKSVVVHDNKVYATGVDWTSNMSKFWIDGQLVHEWQAGGGAGYSDISVHEDKVYVAGCKYDQNMNRHNATVWIYDLNGQLLEELDYSAVSTDSSYATSIIVK